MYKQNLFQNSIYYNWDDIEEGKVYFTLHQKKLDTTFKLHYVLSTKDNKQFDMKLSKQFWENIISVDNLLHENNIKISRGNTKIDTCIDFLSKESVNFVEGMEVLKKITIVN